MFGVGLPCYDQLTPVKKGTGFSIRSRAQARFTYSNQGWFIRTPVNANPGLKVNQT